MKKTIKLEIQELQERISFINKTLLNYNSDTELLKSLRVELEEMSNKVNKMEESI